MNTKRHQTRRIAKALAIATAVAAIGAPVAQAEEFVPGVTDFPSRVADKQPQRFVPAVTDFPSRLGEKAEAAARERLARAEAGRAPAVDATDGRELDWAAVALGAGIGALGMLLAVFAYRMRPRLRAAQSH